MNHPLSWLYVPGRPARALREGGGQRRARRHRRSRGRGRAPTTRIGLGARHWRSWSTQRRASVEVRVNRPDTAAGRDDLAAVADTAALRAIRLPKITSPSDVALVADALAARTTPLCCLIESALGVENAFAIACGAARRQHRARRGGPRKRPRDRGPRRPDLVAVARDRRGASGRPPGAGPVGLSRHRRPRRPVADQPGRSSDGFPGTRRRTSATDPGHSRGVPPDRAGTDRRHGGPGRARPGPRPRCSAWWRCRTVTWSTRPCDGEPRTSSPRRQSSTVDRRPPGSRPQSRQPLETLFALAPPTRTATDLAPSHRRAVARTQRTGLPERDECQGVHSAVAGRGRHGLSCRSQQPIYVGRGQVADASRGMDAGAPQDLVGQQIADAGDRLLVEEARLDRSRAASRARRGTVPA